MCIFPFCTGQKQIITDPVNHRVGMKDDGSRRVAIYRPMKAAVEALTRHVALEPGERRIAMNVVAPGAIAADFSAPEIPRGSGRPRPGGRPAAPSR
ncbi:SDR family oxidoreductase [Consotaella salsifontis]|uniref:SDR family oxidoreductase n=1 Tax=Consotaella salsifontis TaxID=1365950 RepID=UPI001A97AC0C